MAETATPHDAVFKTFLSRVETARDFIELHLPSSLIQICKLDTLRLESGSFLEDDLRPYYSDILLFAGNHPRCGLCPCSDRAPERT